MNLSSTLVVAVAIAAAAAAAAAANVRMCGQREATINVTKRYAPTVGHAVTRDPPEKSRNRL
jgi:predicted porin